MSLSALWFLESIFGLIRLDYWAVMKSISGVRSWEFLDKISFSPRSSRRFRFPTFLAPSSLVWYACSRTFQLGIDCQIDSSPSIEPASSSKPSRLKEYSRIVIRPDIDGGKTLQTRNFMCRRTNKLICRDAHGLKMSRAKGGGG